MNFCLDYEVLDLEDGLTVEAMPLEVQDYQELLSYISKNQTVDGANAQQIGLARMADKEFGRLCKQIIPKYCQNLKGLEITVKKDPREVRPGNVDDLVQYGVFATKCMVLTTKLISMSVVTDEEEKNIKKQ